jgi:hypothetical protein
MKSIAIFVFLMHSASGFAASYMFTPEAGFEQKCVDARMEGKFTFGRAPNSRMYAVQFIDGRKLMLHQSTRFRYIFSAMGDITIYSEIDFERGTLRHEWYDDQTNISCRGTFN